MYNSSICYKHKVESAPHPTGDVENNSGEHPVVLVESLIWIIILLGAAIKWVPWLCLAALAILVMVRRMAPDPSEDAEEEIGRKEIFDYFILPWIGLAVLAILWFLV